MSFICINDHWSKAHIFVCQQMESIILSRWRYVDIKDMLSSLWWMWSVRNANIIIRLIFRRYSAPLAVCEFFYFRFTSYCYLRWCKFDWKFSGYLKIIFCCFFIDFPLIPQQIRIKLLPGNVICIEIVQCFPKNVWQMKFWHDLTFLWIRQCFH